MIWENLSSTNPIVTSKTYRGTLGHIIVYVEYNLHVNSPKEPNWYCVTHEYYRYLDGTEWGGYETLEEAQKAAERAIC